jgi:hypothetical protein
MANEKDINIGIKVAGAEAAVKDLKLVEVASKSVTKGQLDSANSLGPRNDAARERAIRDVQAMADKARVAEIAFYDLGKEIKRVDTPLANLGNTAKGTHGGLSKTGFIANQVSMQVGDFTQQITGGTSALRAFSQQAPQLMGTLTSMGMVTGGVGIAVMAVGAALPILTQGFSSLAASLGPVKESAEVLKQRIDDNVEAMGKLEVDRFTKIGTSIDGAREKAESLKVKFEETKTAQNEFAVATLSNAAKIEEAQKNIAIALGYQIDKFKELKAGAEAEAEKRRVLTEQAISGEKQKLGKAQEEANTAGDVLSQAILRSNQEKANLVILRAQLDALREQEAELKKIVARKQDLSKPLLPANKDVEKYAKEQFSTMGGTAEGAVLRTAEFAQKKLDDQFFQSKLNGTEERLDKLQNLVEQLTAEGTGAVAKAENALNTANGKVADISKAVEINIAKLEDTLAADNLLARSQTVVETQKATAEEMKSAMAGVEAYSETAKAAKDTISKAAADGIVTANETQTVATSFAALLGQIQVGNASSSESINKMIQLQTRILAESADQNARINTLFNKVNSIQDRIR